MCYFISLFLFISTSAGDCQELFSEMTNVCRERCRSSSVVAEIAALMIVHIVLPILWPVGRSLYLYLLYCQPCILIVLFIGRLTRPHSHLMLPVSRFPRAIRFILGVKKLEYMDYDLVKVV